MANHLQLIIIANGVIGLIGLIIGVILRTTYLNDDYYANLWATFVILFAAIYGGKLFKAGADMKPYMFVSGLSLITSLAGAIILITPTLHEISIIEDACKLTDDPRLHCSDVAPSKALNIILMVVLFIDVAVAGGAVYFVHNGGTSAPAPTEVVVNQNVIQEKY